MLYYGYVERFVQESTSPYRSGVEFTLIPCDFLDPILAESENLSPDLRLSYLGDAPLACCHCFFEYPATLEKLPVGWWFKITLSEKKSCNYFDSIFFNSNSNTAFSCFVEIVALPEALVERLTNAFIIPATKSIDEPEFYLPPNIAISYLDIYNVGQALCVGLIPDPWTEYDPPFIYFDLGVPAIAGKLNPHMAPEYNIILNHLYTMASQDEKISVILSHWHLDHIGILAFLSDEVLHKLRIYAPDRLPPSALEIYNKLKTSAGELFITCQEFAQATLYSNKNVLLYKTKAPRSFSASKMNNPHHYCYGMEVLLPSGTKVLLTGDGTYALRSEYIRNTSYDVLQVSHHGGNFAMGLTARSEDVPHPLSPVKSCAVYSYGLNNIHRHPNERFMHLHEEAGWSRDNFLNTVTENTHFY